MIEAGTRSECLCDREKQCAFMNSIGAMARVLDRVGLRRDDWFVLSGGAVALYQYEAGNMERVPTDADIVMRHTDIAQGFELMLEVEREATRHSMPLDIITQPRFHHGYTFTNPIGEMDEVPEHPYGRMLPLDVLTSMVTHFPDNAPIPSLRGVRYKFPIVESDIFSRTHPINVPCAGKIHLAPPGFVAWYKTTMGRNCHGKQDNPDLRRLKNLGAFDDVRTLYEDIQLLSRDSRVTEEVMRALWTNIRQ